jgi:hypothetical protein
MIGDGAYSFAHPRCHFHEGHRVWKRGNREKAGLKKGNDYCPCPFDLPSPFFAPACSSHLPAIGAGNTRALILCFSQISF